MEVTRHYSTLLDIYILHINISITLEGGRFRSTVVGHSNHVSHVTDVTLGNCHTVAISILNQSKSRILINIGLNF